MKKIIFSRKIFILVLTAIVTIAIISFFLAPKKILKTDSLIDNTSVHYDFSSREMCEKQTGWPCRATMCSEDGSGVCNNFIKGRSWGPVLPEYDLYEVEEVLRSDKLQYRGSASVANRYLIKGILVSKQYADCSTCLSLDPSLCSPCPNGKIILASVDFTLFNNSSTMFISSNFSANNICPKWLANIREQTLPRLLVAPPIIATDDFLGSISNISQALRMPSTAKLAI